MQAAFGVVMSKFRFTTLHISASLMGLFLFIGGLCALFVANHDMLAGVCFGALSTMGREFAGTPDKKAKDDDANGNTT